MIQAVCLYSEVLKVTMVIKVVSIRKLSFKCYYSQILNYGILTYNIRIYITALNSYNGSMQL